jgi:hypothetical protein
MIYSLETYDLQWGQTHAFARAFEDVYRPLIEDRGGMLVGAWQATGLSRRWPSALLLWEFDEDDALQDLVIDLHAGVSPLVRTWEEHTSGIVAGAEGRLMKPSRNTPTRAQLLERNVDTSVIVHELIETQPDRANAYCEQIEEVWLPTAAALGRVWIGTYRTMWKNREAVSIWALEDPRRPFAPEDRALSGLGQWTRTALSVRVGYDDGVYVTLDPSIRA